MNFFETAVAKHQSLTFRERFLISAAVAVLVFLAMHFLLVVPSEKKISAAKQADLSMQAELASVKKTLDHFEIDISQGQDPLAEKKIELQAIRTKIAAAKQIMDSSNGQGGQTLTGGLITEMLQSTPGVRLISLKVLPVSLFYEHQNSTPPADATAEPSKHPPHLNLLPKSIYKHGVELIVQGKYLDLLSYLEKLQSATALAYWSEGQLEVKAYPDSTIRLVVFTLSDTQSSPL